jgi:UDP-3-O-[3-hydroxymyristoyl] glucosamine N-acyltransferase
VSTGGVSAATAGDPRFFVRGGPFSAAVLAEACGASLQSPGDAARTLHGVAPLQAAGPGHVSFLDNRRYAPMLDDTSAGAVIVHPALVARVPPGTVALVTPEPYLGWARVSALFHPPHPRHPGIHPSAVVDPAAQVDASAEIGPLAVIEAGAEIGPGCRIGPGVVIGVGVILGADTRVGANASISHAVIGARVFVYPGARVGQEGFGFAITAAGFVTVPQLGRVIVEDDVEIGANTTVDRGSGQDTVIGAGTRLDNLVQIAHNVRLGRCCVVAAQAGISGSTVLEDFVMVGGQAGLTGHLRVGRRARIAAQAGLMSDVAPGAAVAGSPSLPSLEYWRSIAVLRKLAASHRATPAGQDATRAGAPTVGAPPHGQPPSGGSAGKTLA